MSEHNKTYSAAETAAILGIAKSTITTAVRENRAGHLHAIRVGKALRFPKNVIDALAVPEVA